MTNLFETAPEEQQPSAEEWTFQNVNSLNRGLDLSNRSELLRDGNSLVADNIRFEKGQVLIDFGYKTFGQVVRGSPRATFQFFLKNGSSILTLITNLTFYRYVEAVSEWQYPSDGTKTTMNTAEAAGGTTLDVVAIAGFSNGDFIGVELDSGKQHQTTINGAPSGNNITITDAIPSGETAGAGNDVLLAVVLTGTDNVPVSITTWAAFDKMYFANGSDKPMEFDGTNVVVISNLPSSGNTVCRLVAVFTNHLLLMHTTEGGTTFPQRVRWTEPGVDFDWNESVNVNDLYDNEDFIAATETLGTFQVIYKERSIYRMEFLGLADQTWQFTRTIDGEGALNQDAVINLGDEHLFMGNANIYKYDGNFSINPVGDNIFDKIFAQDGELNPEFTSRVFSIYVEELDEAWWFYPSGNDTFPKNMIKLKVSTGAWSVRKFADDLSGFGFFQSQGDVTWQTALGTWAAYEGPWLSKAVQTNAPTLHILSQSNLRVYEYDYITALDNGVAIAFEFVTKDFYVPNRELRFDRYDFMMKGSSVLIEASFDQGVSFETLGTVSPGNVFSRQRLFKQFIGRSIRFRFTGSAGFGLDWLGFKFKRESLWDV